MRSTCPVRRSRVELCARVGRLAGHARACRCAKLALGQRADVRTGLRSHRAPLRRHPRRLRAHHPDIDGLVGELHDPHSTTCLRSFWRDCRSARLVGTRGSARRSTCATDGSRSLRRCPAGRRSDAGVQTGDGSSRSTARRCAAYRRCGAESAPRRCGIHGTAQVERPGVATPLEFALTRKEIHVRPVQHASSSANGVGYVGSTIFSQEAAGDLGAR